ncbi:L-fucose/L-arabinose isomerase family protein [Faecalicatena sp. AGMB00832]|uniref:L-fucose/L-arabinose isomerase family protein n=1 Tax=Faecalicatena faecalis TaxID=2726362 RepID=A0ABS6D1V7_9FIRM|nr:L-fucose/L-arabinose isomerase family protein [Faecalicatena faecalis]MBU3875171.1 L-fucose/L-arabinose isomerase family protein [Faecalicatena faecalis]
MLEEFKNRHRVKLGVAHTRRNLSRPGYFYIPDAIEEKNKIEEFLKDREIEFVNLDFLNEEGIICKGVEADEAADYFIKEGVDAVFAPHLNFGTEDAVARIAKKVNKPLLLWGPRDGAPAPDGSRARDSQCGLFATSKVLKEFGVPFTYIPSSRVEDKIFQVGFDNFISAAAVVKVMSHMRIGQIGTRPGAFWTVKYNEETLLNQFGIEVIPISVVDLKRMTDDVLAQKSSEVQEKVEDIKRRIQVITLTEEELKKVAAMQIAILDWAEAERLSAAALLCSPAFRETMGIVPCFAMGELTGAGFPVACETDIHGAVTSLMVQAATKGRCETFLADMTIRHPENDNAELLWHCGVFPENLRAEDCEPKLADHYGPGIPGVGEYRIKGGDITVARFDGTAGEYCLLIAEGRGTTGPHNKGTYLWAEFKDWVELETRLINGPYIHHCSGVHGHIAMALYEACKYIPGLNPDPVFPTKTELDRFLIDLDK